jgi:hypothetical protein
MAARLACLRLRIDGLGQLSFSGLKSEELEAYLQERGECLILRYQAREVCAS